MDSYSRQKGICRTLVPGLGLLGSKKMRRAQPRAAVPQLHLRQKERRPHPPREEQTAHLV